MYSFSVSITGCVCSPRFCTSTPNSFFSSFGIWLRKTCESRSRWSSSSVLFGASSFTMRRSTMSESTRTKRLCENFCSRSEITGTSSCPSSISTL